MSHVVDATSDLAVTTQQAQLALEKLGGQCANLEASLEELERTRSLLLELPKKLRHSAMVPYGTLAFFPGHVVKTNECYVKSGDYHLHTTAVEAREILARRGEGIQKQLKELKKDGNALQSSLQVLKEPLAVDEDNNAQDNEESIAEITEEYNEFLHGSTSKGSETPHRVGHEISTHDNPTSTSKKSIQPRVSKPRAHENKALSIDDDIFQRLEQLEEEELAAEKTADSKTPPPKSNEAVLAKHVNELSSKPDNGILTEFDSTETCMGLEIPEKKTQAMAESASKLKNTVSWNDKESDEPQALRDMGKSKPLLKGFFDKPQTRKKSALKTSSTEPTPTVKSKEASASPSHGQRPSSQSDHRQSPAVIADVLEREPSTQNQAMDKNLGSSTGTLDFSEALKVNSRHQGVDPAMEHQDSIAQVPKKVSRFKQQRMGASR